jgi:phospholipid transport system substrate-binding protein
MLTRRTLLLASAALLACGLAFTHSTPAAAQSADSAAHFVQQTADKLMAIVNGPSPIAEKQTQLQTIIDQDVDVAEVARFCLGRFWRTATPEQQKEYTELFHRVLVQNITGKVGEYKGVSIVMGRAVPREGDIAVTTTVNRPGNEPSRVDWLVSEASGSPKIIDVIAEGTSLRITQRQDYSSYLAHNNNSIAALISAMQRQAAQNPS